MIGAHIAWYSKYERDVIVQTIAWQYSNSQCREIKGLILVDTTHPGCLFQYTRMPRYRKI